MKWINETGIDYLSQLDNLLGFIYYIELNDGRWYIGRKQFWSRRGGSWYGSDWEDYNSSSKAILEDVKRIRRKSILSVFTSKSAIRYAEAMAIILSGSYEGETGGLNGNFAGCKGKLKLTDQDWSQLGCLYQWCQDRRLL